MSLKKTYGNIPLFKKTTYELSCYILREGRNINTYLYLSVIYFTISLITAKYKTKNIYTSFFNAFAIFTYLALTIIYFSANYFTGEGVNETVLFTVQYGLDGAGFGEYVMLLTVSALSFVIIFAMTYLYFQIIKNNAHPKPKRLKGAIHNVFLILAFVSHPLILNLNSIYKSRYAEQSNDFDQYYKTPNIIGQKAKDLNIVYIYAESLEKTYFDESIFPSLVNNLKELKSKSTEFTNINQIAGSEWTIGGMVSSQCSIPLFTESGGNSGGNSMSGSDTFLKGAECMGDVLKNLGYHLAYIQGSSVEFSGLNHFYDSHHFDEIYGSDELKDHLNDPTYINGWGLYDDTLFSIVFDKFELLSEQDKPFALFMATMDTHHPDGQTSKSCNNIPYGKGENSILNAVHCSDKLISEFIKKIQNSKYANNTLIVLTSDHLAMQNTATQLLVKGERRNLFLIFDPNNKQYMPIKKAGSMQDVAPTVLHKLGINTELGLGRNLFDQKSLYISFNKLFNNYNEKLRSWRKSILKLWEFPKISKTSYSIDLEKKEVVIAEHSYRFPVLFKIDSTQYLAPMFEDPYATKKYYENLIDKFTPVEKFIWIGSCDKINHVFDHNFSDVYCVAQGSLAGKVEVAALQKNMLDINISHMLNDTKIDMTQYNARLKKILNP